MRNDKKLALFGGKPVLEKPFSLYNSIGIEEKRAVIRVMNKKVLSDFVGRAGKKFYGGEYVQKLENKICSYLKVRYAVSFNSATTALQGAVAALGIGPGDEVITSPYTMSATPISILFNGAVPVFADLTSNTFSLDPVSIEKNISPRTKAILVVNLFGGASELQKISAIARKYKIAVIEDNAQSIGAQYKNKFLGTIGDMGILSFNANKVLQCGEGGVLVTNNRKLAFRAQLVRNHGEAVIDDLYQKKGIYEPIIGSNYRMTELHAAIALEQMKKINRLIKSRIKLARHLTKHLEQFLWLIPQTIIPKSTHIYYVYAFKFFIKKIGILRSTFAHAMAKEGFPLGEGYVKPLYLLPLFQKKEMFPRSKFPFFMNGKKTTVSYKKGICPVTERLYEKELLFTTICAHNRSKKDIDLFVRALEKIERNIDLLKQYERRQS